MVQIIIKNISTTTIFILVTWQDICSLFLRYSGPFLHPTFRHCFINDNSSIIIFIHPAHLSHPGQVMFLARSQWKHLRASTEVEERIEANTTVTETSPNIFSTGGDSSPCSLTQSLITLWVSLIFNHPHLLAFYIAITDDNLSWCHGTVKDHKQQIVKSVQ